MKIIENIKLNILISVIISYFYFMLWNSIHPEMHNVDLTNKITWRDGVKPQNVKKIKNNFIYQWLLKYHSIHHLQKHIKKNFNIILAGMDLWD